MTLQQSGTEIAVDATASWFEFAVPPAGHCGVLRGVITGNRQAQRDLPVCRLDLRYAPTVPPRRCRTSCDDEDGPKKPPSDCNTRP